MYKQIRKELLLLQDNKFKKFHSKLCPGINNIIGIKLPTLRKYAKKKYQQINVKEYISFDNTLYYEEIMLKAIFIGLLKNIEVEEFTKIIEDFVPKIDNWAVCDTFCSELKVITKNKEHFWKFIQKYLKSKKEFELRFAIVIMLNYYINETYIDEVLKRLDSIKHDVYYVKMAIAWAISVAFVKFEDKSFKYLSDNNLDDWTYNKSLQKIAESLRVSKKTKQIIKTMKRN